MDFESGRGGSSGGEEATSSSCQEMKASHRHTAYQTQILEE